MGLAGILLVNLRGAAFRRPEPEYLCTGHHLNARKTHMQHLASALDTVRGIASKPTRIVAASLLRVLQSDTATIAAAAIVKSLNPFGGRRNMD